MSSPQNPEQSSMESTEEVREGPSSEWKGLSRNGPVILLWLAWTISCAIVAAAVMPLEFLGDFVLGGVFGVVQWLVLRAYLGRLNLWAPVSFFGWFVGINIAILVLPVVGPGLSALAGRHEALAYQIVLEPLKYATLGFAQWLLLRPYLHRAGWWVLASVVGGLLGTTALMGLSYAGEPMSSSMSAVVFAGIPGLIYGAITGATLVWLSSVERSVDGTLQTLHQDQQQERSTAQDIPRSRAAKISPVVLIGVGSVILIVVLLVRTLPGSPSTCDEEERAVFIEFPQYGGTQAEPENVPESGTCAAFFGTEDSADQVRAYYEEQLTAHGWTIKYLDSETEGGEGEFGGPLVNGRRGEFRYEVFYENREFYTPPQQGVHLAVHVGKNEG